MEKNNKTILDAIRSFIKNIWTYTSLITYLFIYTILIMGSLSSTLLFIKLYPFTAKPIITTFINILLLLSHTFIILISAFFGSGILYLLLKYLLIPLIEKNKKLRESNRLKFKEELTNDIVNKLRRKR